MNGTLLILLVIAGYLIGAVSFARIVARLVNPSADLNKARTRQADTGETGTVSGIGASTASMALGNKFGFVVALLDMLKTFIPTIVLRALYPDDWYFLLFGIAAIIGHIYPIYYRFEGGRGLSPMLGSLLAIDPIGTIVSMIAGTLLAILLNQPTASLILWFPLLSVWAWLVRRDAAFAVFGIALLVLFLIAEIPEIRLARQYMKEGRLDDYNKMIIDSSSQTRGMKRLSEKIRFWEKKKDPAA